MYGMMTLMSIMGLAMGGPIPAEHSAELDVWDCSKPVATAVYAGNTFCSAHEHADLHDQQQPAILAQIVTRHKAAGFRCEVRRTTRSHICGAFSYEKALPYLTETTQVQLSANECRNLKHYGIFRDSSTGHEQQGLLGVGTWHFTAAVRGLEYVDDGDTTCQGVTAMIDGRRIDRLVQTAEYTVAVTEERFELTANTADALSTGEHLECKPDEQGCVGVQHTYCWVVPDSFSCPLQVIKSVGFTQRAGRMRINPTEQLVVELGPQGPTKQGSCPGLWFTTQEPRLVVMVNATDLTGMQHVQPEEVDPFLSLSMVRSYIAYTRKWSEGRANHDLEKTTCGRQMDQLETGQTIILAPGQFARRVVDTVETFSCHSTRVTIRTANICYQDIPVDGPLPFAAARTRILKSASPVVPCAREFPARVEGLRGQWWRIDPAVIQDTRPQQWRGVDVTHAPTHMDRPAGLYSASERRQWAALQAVPIYREQLYNAIELGSCGSLDSCPAAHMGGHSGGFDVGRLAEQVPGYAWYQAIMSPTNWVIAIIGLMSTINFIGVMWYYCTTRRAADRGETKTTVTVNQAAVRVNNMLEGATRPAEPVIATGENRCGIAEVSELTTFPMATMAPSAPTGTVILSTKPVY